MFDEFVGKKLKNHVGRDAIHIAMISVRASETLFAGDKVGVIEGNPGEFFAERSNNPIGIVDPFLQDVNPGDIFLLWLFPKSVTDMKHHWSHPLFDVRHDQKELSLKEQLQFEINKQNPRITADELINAIDEDSDTPGYYVGDKFSGFTVTEQMTILYYKITGHHYRAGVFRCPC